MKRPQPTEIVSRPTQVYEETLYCECSYPLKFESIVDGVWYGYECRDCGKKYRADSYYPRFYCLNSNTKEEDERVYLKTDTFN